MEKRLRSSLQSSADDFLRSAIKSTFKSVKPSLKTLIYSITSSSPLASSLPSSLHLSISHSLSKFNNLSHTPYTSPQTPPTKRLRRSSRHRVNPIAPDDDNRENPRQCIIQSLQTYTYILHLCLSHPNNLFSASDLLPSASQLHDNLVLFESEPALSSEIALLCEEWWKGDLVGKETLISQSLPFLLSRSLTLKKKVDVHRVYLLREAFTLFDFEDESIEDLKHLLIRCLISPLYLKTEDGRKFIASMFGLSGQLVKEALAIVKSQIPFGRKSMLEAYGEIVFKAWKAVEGEAKEEIENGFLQGLIESAIHASTETFSASIRRVLGGFISRRTVEGVEKLLFRLAEPVIFRSLQAANSNVRQNALHLLLDLFPFEDPDATMDVKDSLLEKQSFLLEKLLMDECPDIRVVAVEGCSRILNMFWEIVPSRIITKIITIIFDQMASDACTEVRLSTLNGVIYLLGNPLSHEVLKVLLPRLGRLIEDAALSVRVAVLDLLLCLNDIRNFQFHKVVTLDILLTKLADDQPVVGQKITKLLIPSYLPMKVSQEEASNRCLALIKRSPIAGARFCEFALSEGASLESLMKLFNVLLGLVLSPGKLGPEQLDGLLIAASHLSRNLMNNRNYKVLLHESLSVQKLKHLFAAATTARARSSVCDIVAAIVPHDVDGLFNDSIRAIINCSDLNGNVERQDEVRSIHKMMISCNRFEDMFEAIAGILQKTVAACNARFSPSAAGARKRSKAYKKLPNFNNNFKEDYAVAAGIAWQIKDLLVSQNTRKEILLSPHMEAVFYALKVVSEVSVLECVHCDDMSAPPISAYTALALHISLDDMNMNEIKLLDIQNKCFPDTAKAYPEKTILELTMDHLFSCTSKLFRPNESGRSGSAVINQNRVSNLMKILTAILKFTVDTAMMDLVPPDQERSMNFVIEHIKFIISSLKKCSSDDMQFSEERLTEIFFCLKSSMTYGAKFLSVVFVHSSEASLPLGCWDLANELLDLIVTIEECLGYGYATRLLATIKPWLPDIILALGSWHLLKPDSAKSGATGHTVSHCPLWLYMLAKIELSDLRNVESDEDSGASSQKKGLIAFRKLMEMLLQQLRMNYNILDAVGLVFLSVSRLGLERTDFDLLLGLLHFVCVKIFGHNDLQQGDLKLTLAMAQEMYHLLEIETEKLSNSEDRLREKLYFARSLLKPVLINYSFNEDRDQTEAL